MPTFSISPEGVISSPRSHSPHGRFRGIVSRSGELKVSRTPLKRVGWFAAGLYSENTPPLTVGLFRRRQITRCCIHQDPPPRSGSDQGGRGPNRQNRDRNRCQEDDRARQYRDPPSGREVSATGTQHLPEACERAGGCQGRESSSDVSSRITWGKFRVNWTTRTLRILGRICLV